MKKHTRALISSKPKPAAAAAATTAAAAAGAATGAAVGHAVAAAAAARNWLWQQKQLQHMRPLLHPALKTPPREKPPFKKNFVGYKKTLVVLVVTRHTKLVTH